MAVHAACGMVTLRILLQSNEQPTRQQQEQRHELARPQDGRDVADQHVTQKPPPVPLTTPTKMTPATGMSRASASCIPITAKMGMPTASMMSMSFCTVSAVTTRVSGSKTG